MIPVITPLYIVISAHEQCVHVTVTSHTLYIYTYLSTIFHFRFVTRIDHPVEKYTNMSSPPPPPPSAAVTKSRSKSHHKAHKSRKHQRTKLHCRHHHESSPQPPPPPQDYITNTASDDDQLFYKKCPYILDSCDYNEETIKNSTAEPLQSSVRTSNGSWRNVLNLDQRYFFTTIPQIQLKIDLQLLEPVTLLPFQYQTVETNVRLNYMKNYAIFIRQQNEILAKTVTISPTVQQIHPPTQSTSANISLIPHEFSIQSNHRGPLYLNLQNNLNAEVYINPSEPVASLFLNPFQCCNKIVQ